MKLKRSRQSTGFSLIELVVVVGVLGIVMIISGVVLTNSMRMSNRVAVTDDLESTGTWILSELKRVVLLARNGTVSCSGAGTRVDLENRLDENQIWLSCESASASISSNSAVLGSMRLNPETVRVTGCGTFVTCSSGSYPTVTIRFTLENEGGDKGVDRTYQRSFETTVTMRQ